MGSRKQPYRSLWIGLFIVVSILPLMGLYKLSSETGPGLAASFLAVISILTAFLYYRDKRAAERGRRRTPESVLHLLEFLGGWPCAFWAQRILRHKIRKVAYQVVFWLIVLVHQVVAFDYQSGGIISRRVLPFLE